MRTDHCTVPVPVRVSGLDSRAPTRTGWGGVRLFLDTIKFEHSIFALPFAVLSAFLVSGGIPAAKPLLWVLVAMVSARTLGMGANRLIDAGIDARNPRTSGRALPAGLIQKRQVWGYLAISASLFGVSVSQLHPMTWYLSPIVILMLAVYPYTKRFTWLSHLALGAVYLVVPPAVWIAMTGELNAGITLIGVAAMLWVAGFDILYGTADIEVDRAQGLHSIPARFGLERAFIASRMFHTISVILLMVAGVTLGAGVLYYAGTTAVATLLWYEHRLISPRDRSNLNTAFFTMNGVIAVVFSVFVCLDTVAGQ